MRPALSQARTIDEVEIGRVDTRGLGKENFVSGCRKGMSPRKAVVDGAYSTTDCIAPLADKHISYQGCTCYERR